MFNKNSKKGFTLMEMLIVVAIIAILIAIAIPTMTSSLQKARRSADMANIRSAYAEVSVTALTENAEQTSDEVEITSDGNFGTDWPSYLGTMPDVAKGDKVTVTVSVDGEATVNKA